MVVVRAMFGDVACSDLRSVDDFVTINVDDGGISYPGSGQMTSKRIVLVGRRVVANIVDVKADKSYICMYVWIREVSTCSYVAQTVDGAFYPRNRLLT